MEGGNIGHEVVPRDRRTRETRSGVCGANIEPIRPTVEHVLNNVCLKFVGNISLVYIYKTVNDIVIANFPNKNKIKRHVV